MRTEFVSLPFRHLLISLLRALSYFGLGYTPSLAFTSGMAACVKSLLTNKVEQDYAKTHILREHLFGCAYRRLGFVRALGGSRVYMNLGQGGQTQICTAWISSRAENGA